MIIQKRTLWNFIFPVFLLVLLLGCFGGVKKTGKVVGYKDGHVLTKKGFYQVGTLPPTWSKVNLGKALVAFYNGELKSTISTDSFCDQAYNDSSLKMLTKHLFAGLQETQVIEEKPFMLNKREALQTLIKAKLDGVPVMVDIVVIKKNWCLFDFFLVSETGNYARAAEDFEVFYRGFSYSGGV
jgi:hypothetical protein